MSSHERFEELPVLFTVDNNRGFQVLEPLLSAKLDT